MPQAFMNLLLSMKPTPVVIQIAFNPESTLLAYSTNKSLNMWDIATQTSRWNIPVESGGSIAFSPDSTQLAARVDYNLSLWDVDDGKQQVALSTPTQQRTGFVTDVAYVETRNELIGVAALSGGLIRWNADSGDFISEYSYGFDQFVGAEYSILSPDGTLNVLSRITYSIEFRNTIHGDIRNRVQIDDLLGFDATKSPAFVTPLAISSDNQALLISVIFATGQQPNQIILLSTNGEIVQHIELDDGKVRTGAFNSNGDIIALGDQENGKIYLLNAATGAEIIVLNGHTEWISDLVFSPDGTLLASGGADGTVRLWGVAGE